MSDLNKGVDALAHAIDNATDEERAAWYRRGYTDAIAEAVTVALGRPADRNVFIPGDSDVRVLHYGEVIEGRHLVVLIELGAPQSSTMPGVAGSTPDPIVPDGHEPADALRWDPDAGRWTE